MADPADEECKVIGRFTRYLWNIFKLYHVDGKLQICDIHKAFLDLNLYPSHSQIEEMVHCAIYVNPRLEHHVTFDEFCVLADELLHHYETCSTNSMPHSHISSKSSYSAIEGRRKKKDIKSSWQVFLGGSCGTSSNPTRWRHDEAIPFLKEKEVTFYNPQENNWRPELIEIEERAKQGADLLFFLIDNATRAVVSLCEIAYLVGCHRQIIVIFTDFEEEVTSVNNVSLFEEERIDLSQARKVLVDLIERNGIPVFTNLKQALDCAVLNIRQKIRVQDLTHKHGVQPPKHGHALVGETLIKLRDIFNSFTSNSEDTITQTDLLLSYKCLKGKEMSPEWLENCKPNSNSFTFDEYCRIISEHKRQEMPKVFCQSCVPFLFKLRKFFSDACTPQRIQPKKEEIYDIYLGGSCGDTDWRENIVLPKIRHFGLSYHNPHVTLWYNNMIPMQVAEREKCRLMLYVITGSIPSVAAMVEAAYYIGLGCRVVLCIQNLRPNPSNTGQGFYPCALQDYNRGRAYLSDMASREGVPEFENIEDATECAIQEIQKLSPLH